MIASVFQAVVTWPATPELSRDHMAEEACSPDGSQEAKTERGKIGSMSQSFFLGNDRNDLDPPILKRFCELSNKYHRLPLKISAYKP